MFSVLIYVLPNINLCKVCFDPKLGLQQGLYISVLPLILLFSKWQCNIFRKACALILDIESAFLLSLRSYIKVKLNFSHVSTKQEIYCTRLLRSPLIFAQPLIVLSRKTNGECYKVCKLKRIH